MCHFGGDIIVNFAIFTFCRGAKSANILQISTKMLFNKINISLQKKDGFDTAENEPSEILFLYFNIPRFEN